MRINFRSIRGGFQRRLRRFRLRLIYTRLKLLGRVVTKLGPEDIAALGGLEAVGQEFQSMHRQWLFTYVGQALHVWGQMESTLVAISSLLIKTEADKAGVIMYSIINFQVWLQLINELFPLEPKYMPLKPRWDKLAARLRALKDTRDRLGHHVVHTRDDTGLEDGTSLRPATYDLRSKSQKYQSLSRDSVSDVNTSLAALVTAMAEILKRESSQQKSAEQGPGQRPP